MNQCRVFFLYLYGCLGTIQYSHCVCGRCDPHSQPAAPALCVLYTLQVRTWFVAVNIVAQLVDSCLSHCTSDHVAKILSLDYTGRVAQEPDWPALENGFSPVHSSVKMLQEASTLLNVLCGFQAVLTHPEKLLAHFTYLCVHSRPGELLTTTLSLLTPSSWSPFPDQLVALTCTPLMSCIYLYC